MRSISGLWSHHNGVTLLQLDYGDPGYPIVSCVPLYKDNPRSGAIDCQLNREVGTRIGEGSPGKDVEPGPRSDEGPRMFTVPVARIGQNMVIDEDMVCPGVDFFVREEGREGNDILWGTDGSRG